MSPSLWTTVCLALTVLVVAVEGQNVLTISDSVCSQCGEATIADIQAAYPSATYTTQIEDLCTLAFGAASVPTTYDALIYSQIGRLGACAGGGTEVANIEAFANSGRFVLVTGYASVRQDNLQAQLVGGTLAVDVRPVAAAFNNGAVCDLLLNGPGGDIRGASTSDITDAMDNFTTSSATSCLDNTRGDSVWSVRPMANGGAIAYMATSFFIDDYTTIAAYSTALNNFMAAAAGVTGGGGDPHLFGMAINRRFDPVLSMKAVLGRDFSAMDMVLVETQSATMTARVNQLRQSEEKYYITALEIGTREAKLVISVDEAGLTFTDSLDQVTSCGAAGDGVFGASLNNRVSVRGGCSEGSAVAAGNRLMQKKFASHIELVESHCSVEMDNVQVEVFSVRKQGHVFLDFSVTHDIGSEYGGLLTNMQHRSARDTTAVTSSLLERYVDVR